MIHAFVDTNVIIDLIADRKPFSKFAIAIFEASENSLIKLYTSSHTIATTHYLLKKHVTEKTLRNVLQDILSYLQVIAIDVDILRKSLRSNHKDFEDAIQMTATGTVPTISYIVTRNIKDFKTSEVPAISPESFCALYKKS